MNSEKPTKHSRTDNVIAGVIAAILYLMAVLLGLIFGGGVVLGVFKWLGAW